MPKNTRPAPAQVLRADGKSVSRPTPAEGDEIFRYAAELADLIVWTADARGEFLSISPRFTELTGLPPGSQRTAMHPDDAERTIKGWEEATAAGVAYAAEFRMRVQDGSYRYFRARSGPRRYEDGRLVGWYGFTEDIHDRRLAQIARDEMEERYRLAFQATNDALYDLDLVAREISWRATGSAFFGYPAQDGPTPLSWWAERIHPEDRDRVVRGFEGIITSDRDRWTVDYRFQKADGSFAHLHDQGLIVRDLNKRALRAVGAMTDCTQQRQAEAELKRTQEELIELARRTAMGTMASTLAHELNQPLAAASNYISGAKRLASQSELALPAPMLDALESAASSTLRAGEIVRRVHELVARGTISAGAVKLPALISEASVLAFVDAGMKGIRHRCDCDPEAEWVWADRIQIQQVLINLIRNAIEAMENSEVREIEISTRRLTDDLIEVRVTDSGTGIDPDKADTLFSQFMTTKSGGMGIGLPISRTIVEAHGGRIWAEPAGRGGAEFVFTLPASSRDRKGPARP